VIPFRIDPVNPREKPGYFLETVQWFDASTPPWQKHPQVLSEHVKRLLAKENDLAQTPALPRRESNSATENSQ
jgi:hypothetical protein